MGKLRLRVSSFSEKLEVKGWGPARSPESHSACPRAARSRATPHLPPRPLSQEAGQQEFCEVAVTGEILQVLRHTSQGAGRPGAQAAAGEEDLRSPEAGPQVSAAWGPPWRPLPLWGAQRVCV